MSGGDERALVRSVRQRLFNYARHQREDFQLVLSRYGVERLLYRLSRSAHRDAFVLKGAMLFQVWGEELYRPTRDLDLLGRGNNSLDHLATVFREICAMAVEDDGLTFDPALVRATLIKEGAEYEGVRVRLRATLGETRIPVQVDVGFGDAITPEPEQVTFPALLEFPAPVVRAYPLETVVAEKYEAMVDLGATNSRMKDFYDLWMLSRVCSFDGVRLSTAIQRTFQRRGTRIPESLPVALTAGYFDGERARELWRGFLERSNLDHIRTGLDAVMVAVEQFLMPPTNALRDGGAFAMTWPAGGPWRSSDNGKMQKRSTR
jgi:Nucleotidyl transferase AbiEii toxin, Type IV TA system